MTPETFAATYRPTADLVSAGTGIDPIALLSQWANETAWGTVVVGNNLGNIRCSPTTFCRYATLRDFADGCISTFHNGYYEAVLAAKDAVSQLNAIVASPWAAGHYGGSLMAYYNQLEAYELTPDQDTKLTQIWTILTQLGTYPVGQAALDSAQILRNLGTYPVGKGAIAAGDAAPKILQGIVDLKAAIAAGGAALTPAQAQQLSHIETMLTTGLKGT
jgi:hypothetical protein